MASGSPRSAPLVGALALAFGTCASAQSISCADALHLAEQSTTGFALIGSETRSEFGGLESSLHLPGARYCVIADGTTTEAYRCVWDFPYRDVRASEAFEIFASTFADCLGDKAAMRKDQPVNHPDSYDSYLFALPGAEARISLKDKRELDSTFVSFVMEATPDGPAGDN